MHDGLQSICMRYAIACSQSLIVNLSSDETRQNATGRTVRWSSWRTMVKSFICMDERAQCTC